MHVRLLLASVCCVLVLAGAEKHTVQELLQLSHKSSSAFHQALLATLDPGEIRKGTAVLGEGPDFIWAVEAEMQPALYIDDEAAGKMSRLAGTKIWFYIGQLKTGTAHWFHYVVNGARFGGRNDIPAFGPDSYEHAGVPRGHLSEKLVHTSRIYEGMKSDYWIYVPAQYRASEPAALMVWQDGHNLVDREKWRAQIVFDNLTYQKKIPVIIHILLDPGTIGDKKMRSIEYDTVDDRYARFLRDEVVPEVQQKYSLRKDAYSRAIAGLSSGGICSFNVAWQQPDQFSRVLSWIGSFTSIQWRPGVIDGGNVYPFKIRKEPKRNIRVWLQEGSEDLENAHGSWPLQNLQMANSLKMMGYDFHLSFGHGTHNAAHGTAELPEELVWLWRDYDPAKTEQLYEMEPGEKEKPLFRVKLYNR